MPLLRRIFYSFKYLRKPPWDMNIVPPEVGEFIATHSPGLSLDLGCGTGTSSLALARAGWQVTGVDYVYRAIRHARKKAAAANLAANFLLADVTHLPASITNLQFSLVLDVGCLHGLTPSGRKAYLNQLRTILSPGGTWLLYGFTANGDGNDRSYFPVIRAEDINRALEFMSLVKRQDGTDRHRRTSAWFWFIKRDA